MTKLLNKDTRKTVLSINKSLPAFIQELLNIRGNVKYLKEDIDAFRSSDKAITYCLKKRANIFISLQNKNTNLVIGRIFNNKIIEIIKFEVLESKNLNDFKETTTPPECFTKNMVIAINIQNPKITNLFMDLFHHKSNKVNLDGLHYAWRLAQIPSFVNEGESEKEENGKDEEERIDENLPLYELCYLRILNDHSVEEIGPSMKLKEVEYFHNEELFEESLPVKGKNQKNIKKNEQKDVIGRIYTEKQDLKDVKVRKSLKKLSK